MKTIELLVDHIEAELEDACTYAKLALKYKDSNPDMANMFSRLSADEMGHMDALHKSVVSQIETYRRTNGEPPAAMKAVYDFLHKRFISKAEDIAILQNMYKR